MLILLDGCDGSGKSTLAHELVAVLETAFPGDEVELLKKGPPSEHPLDEYERPLFGYRPGAGRHIICDRWHVGEFIYPRLLGRTSHADTAVWRHMDMFLRSRGAVLVHMDPTPREIARNIEVRGDAVIRPDQVNEVVTRYQDVIAEAELVTFRVAQIGDPLTVSRVIAAARAAEDAARPLTEFVTYVGPPRPDYLLLGDVRHSIRDTVHLFAAAYDTLSYGPAFGPYVATSGHYLLRHLPSGVWPCVGLANACDVDRPDRLYAALGKPRTVTLGLRALDRLRRLGVPAGSAPHPQYWRRFLNRHSAQYGEVIEQALLTGKDLTRWRPTEM